MTLMEPHACLSVLQMVAVLCRHAALSIGMGCWYIRWRCLDAKATLGLAHSCGRAGSMQPTSPPLALPEAKAEPLPLALGASVPVRSMSASPAGGIFQQLAGSILACCS